jgi:hypothetical protein
MPNSSSCRGACGWLASAHHRGPRATDVPWAGAYPCVHRVRHGLAQRVATAATTPLSVGIPLRIAGHRGGRRGRGVPEHVGRPSCLFNSGAPLTLRCAGGETAAMSA